MGPGALIAGKYRLKRLLGEGAMGVVWAAVNELTEREVAVKLLQTTGQDAAQLRGRLLREARACGRIEHPNVIEIYDVGTTDEGEPFLVMRLLRGESLYDLLRREGCVSPALATRIAAEVCKGLEAAHAGGVTHRDLKPGNLFLHVEPGADTFTVKILDFGVSKLPTANDALVTVTGSAIGSPAYMSPEQARGLPVGHQSDLWAIGVILFEMIAGHRPFPGATQYAVVLEILTGEIPRLSDAAPGVDPRLSAIVSRCLERDISHRALTAGELARDLENLLEPRPSMSSTPALRTYEPDLDGETARLGKPADDEPTRLMTQAPAKSSSVTSTSPFLQQSPSRAATPKWVWVGLATMIAIGVFLTLRIVSHTSADAGTPSVTAAPAIEAGTVSAPASAPAVPASSPEPEPTAVASVATPPPATAKPSAAPRGRPRLPPAKQEPKVQPKTKIPMPSSPD